jgi:type I restriction enzyme M protein
MVTSDPISRATDICIGLGWRVQDAAPVIALMMVWARLAPKASRVGTREIHVPGFFEEQEELTARAWTGVLSGLRHMRADRGDQWALDSIESTTATAGPGKLESLRQAVRDFLAPGGSKKIDLDRVRQGARMLMSLVTDENQILADLIIRALQLKPDESVYCGFDLSAPVALEIAQEQNVYAQLPDVALARLLALLAIAGDYSLEVSRSHPIQNKDASDLVPWADEPNRGTLRAFDHAVALPPFNVKYPIDRITSDMPAKFGGTSMADVLHFSLILARGSKRRIILIPDGFLFRTTKDDQSYKRSLISRYGLNSVVSLPRGIIGIGAGVSSSLLIFHALPEQAIRFIDCRSNWPFKSRLQSPQATQHQLRIWIDRVSSDVDKKYVALVPFEELAANDFNLLVDRYVINPELRRQRHLLARQRTVPLDDLADLHRPQAFKPTPHSRRPPLAETITMREVGTSDIHDGIVRRPEKQIEIWAGDVDQIERVLLRPGDILISVKGKVGVAGVVPEDAPKDISGAWTAGQSFAIARLRQTPAISSPAVLARYLASPFGQTQLQALAGGTTVQFIQMTDLKRLAIPVPSVETQRKIVQKLEKIQSLRDTVRNIEADIAYLERELSDLFLGARGENVH